jgi:predicted nucleic acid-binding protein
MSRLLLDTTVLIDVLRGRPAAARLRSLRLSDEPPYVCAINIEELWRGLREGEDDAVSRLTAGLRLAPLSRREATIAGGWRRDYAANGITLSQADCLIAAAALGVGARLATGNARDFPMAELVVEAWPVGE